MFKIIYWTCFNASVIGAILAGVSTNNKLKEERHDLYLLKKEFPNTDYASKIIAFIKMAFISLCPIIHLYTAYYAIIKWEELRDGTYKKVVAALELKKIEVRERINSGNYF